GQPHRQRVRRSRQRLLLERPHRDGPPAPQPHRGHQLTGQAAGETPGPEGGGGLMTGIKSPVGEGYRRRLVDRLMVGLALLSVGVSLVPLASLLLYVVSKGLGALSWDFLTKLPAPVGEPGGGVANAIVGSGIVVGLAALIGVPLGVLAGIYLAQYGRNTVLGTLVRFFADVLQGVPSI